MDEYELTRGFFLLSIFGGTGPLCQRCVSINNAEITFDYDNLLKWLSVEIITSTMIKYFCEGQIYMSCPPCDVKICTGRAWINIYITPLSKTHRPDSSKNSKYFSRVWRSTIISKKEQVARAQRDIPKLYKLEFSFMRIIPICACYAQELTKILSNTASSLSETEYSVLWKIPLGGPRPCPAIRNMLFLMVTEKITILDFFKRLKIQNELWSLQGSADCVIKRDCPAVNDRYF